MKEIKFKLDYEFIKNLFEILDKMNYVYLVNNKKNNTIFHLLGKLEIATDLSNNLILEKINNIYTNLQQKNLKK